MRFVNEILRARLEDNLLDASNIRGELVQLSLELEEESDRKEIILEIRKDLQYEYRALKAECRELEQALILIENHEKYKSRHKKRTLRLASDGSSLKSSN